MHLTPARRSATLTRCLAAALAAALLGCGSTRTSHTARTATEQLLISDAIDRTVQQIDFGPLRGEAVYLDESRLNEVVDKSYLISSLRQHMLASGCVVKDVRDQATFIVEPRSGAVGTDNDDLLFGVPAVNVPQVPLAPALPATIPEIPFAKRRKQRGIAKLAVFAYRRETGEPAWQSGIAANESTANDIWVLGAGPFKRGTIYDANELAGAKLGPKTRSVDRRSTYVAGLDDSAVFSGLDSAPDEPMKDPAVMQASAAEPAAATEQPAAPAAQPAPAELPPATIDMGPPVLPPPRPLSEAPPPQPQA